jgi:hypothetical protein
MVGPHVWIVEISKEASQKEVSDTLVHNIHLHDRAIIDAIGSNLL